MVPRRWPSGSQRGTPSDASPTTCTTAGEERPARRARSAGPRARTAPVEALLRRACRPDRRARPMPLSASVMINKEEVLELLDEAIERLPEELRAARWLLKEREEFLAKVRAEGDEILERPGPGRAHGAAHRGREGGRAAGPPDRRGGRGRGPAAAPRGRGLLRPAPRQLRDRARAHPARWCRPAARSSRARRSVAQEQDEPADEAGRRPRASSTRTRQ